MTEKEPIVQLEGCVGLGWAGGEVGLQAWDRSASEPLLPALGPKTSAVEVSLAGGGGWTGPGLGSDGAGPGPWTLPLCTGTLCFSPWTLLRPMPGPRGDVEGKEVMVASEHNSR